jgi:hypothetical protein
VGINSQLEHTNGNQKVMLVQVQFLMLMTLQNTNLLCLPPIYLHELILHMRKSRHFLKILMFNDALLEHGLN